MHIDTAHAQNFILDMCEPQYNAHAQSLQPYTAMRNVAMPANALFHNLYKDTGNDYTGIFHPDRYQTSCIVFYIDKLRIVG